MSRYLETVNELTKGLNSIFSGLTLGKFLKWITTLIAIVVIVLFVFEFFFSSAFYYDRMDRKIHIIEKVKKIGANDERIREQANERLLEILEDLDAPTSKAWKWENFNFVISDSIWNSIIKFLGAVIFPLIILVSARRDPDRKNIMVGVLALIAIFGTISFFIPVIYSVWVNFVLMIAIEIILLLFFAKKS